MYIKFGAKLLQTTYFILFFVVYIYLNVLIFLHKNIAISFKSQTIQKKSLIYKVTSHEFDEVTHIVEPIDMGIGPAGILKVGSFRCHTESLKVWIL